MSRSLSFLDRRRGSLAGAILAAAFFLAGSSSQAVVVLSGTGTGVNPISASAIFEFGAGGDPNLLDITLINTSTVPTRYPADVLTSFYFDICKPGRGGTMISPPLGYVSAVGRVFQVQSGTGNDIPAVYFPPLPPSTTGTFFQPLPGTSDLRALNDGANTWQFKMMDTGSAPFYQYGVGTVGNSTSGTTGYVWSPNNFEAQKVGQGEFGIYSGESPTLQNQLENRYLVSGSITFRFSGVNGFGDECIKDAMFGFGTSPDAVINLPEPGGLAACGLLAAAILGGLSRPRAPRSLAAALGFAAVVVAILIAMPAVEAGPVIVDDAFDFSAGPLGWTATPVGKNGFLPPSDPGMNARWAHGGDAWSVNWAPVSGPLVATGNYLTSGPIDASDQTQQAGGGRLVDLIRISIGHKFGFGSFSGSIPPAAGQVAYSINDNPFVAISGSAWQTGSVLAPSLPDPFGASPLWPAHVSQTTLVKPGFTPPVGAYPDLFPLLNAGAAFTGSTPGYSSTGGAYVPSVAVIAIPLQEITSLRIRLINANLGSSCETGAGWDVGYLQTDFAAPEPPAAGLATAGGLALAAVTVRNRRAPATPPVARACVGHG